MSRYDEGGNGRENGKGRGGGDADGDEQVLRPSRYRSLRNPAASGAVSPESKGTTTTSRDHESDQSSGHATGNSISRVMSRYRRRTPNNAASVTNSNATTTPRNDASANNNIPPVPAIPLLKTANGPTTAENQAGFACESSTRRQLQHSTTQRRERGTPIEPADDRVEHSNASTDRSEGLNMEQQRDFSWEADRDRLLEEQKKKDLQRLEEQLENSTRNKVPQSPKRRGPVVEKLVLLARGKSRHNNDSKDEMSPLSPTAILTRTLTRRSNAESVKKTSGHIEPGGKGIVPQKDAPTSAINAGERHVTVRWQQHVYSLPVTPETTSFDLMAQASSRYDVSIRPELCLVVERYGILGLERRLRRYERIRDVMNSWDRDTQNQLLISPRDPRDNHEDLDASAVADNGGAPSGCQLYMYHSNRPGKWNKGWITLLESGQIISARKPNAKLAEKGTTTLCHLSDYDIYTPTESQIKKHIKPPSRLCFAIKSQHKTTVFLNTEKYVQYFSIEDQQAAEEFRQKVHAWRSKYLVDRTPEVRKKQSGSTTKTDGSLTANRSTSKQSDNVPSADGPRLQVAIDESSYSIGQFEPLLDMKRFDRRMSDFGNEFLSSDSNTSPKHKESQNLLRRFSRKDRSEYKSPTRSNKGGENMEILAGGLLGDGYELRKQALADSDNNMNGTRNQPFTEGPSLLNGQRDADMSTDGSDGAPSSWFPSALEHTAKKRINPQNSAMQPSSSASLNSGSRRPSNQPSSHYQYTHGYAATHANPLSSQPSSMPYSDRRGPPKPLVDLTPKIAEPPQWSQEKKGHGVKPPEGLNHLVDFISVGNGKAGRHPEPPPRTVPRNALPALSRTRSMSSASGQRIPLVLDEAPPVPLVPANLDLAMAGVGRRLVSDPLARFAAESVSIDGRLGQAPRQTIKRDKEREREREKARLREREREQRYREREAAYNAVPGRTGTLKVV